MRTGIVRDVIFEALARPAAIMLQAVAEATTCTLNPSHTSGVGVHKPGTLMENPASTVEAPREEQTLSAAGVTRAGADESNYAFKGDSGGIRCATEIPSKQRECQVHPGGGGWPRVWSANDYSAVQKTRNGKNCQEGEALKVAKGEVLLFNEQYVVKPPNSSIEFRWHTDEREQLAMCIFPPGKDPPVYVSVWLALDDCNRDNGCLEVYPHSLTHPQVEAPVSPGDDDRVLCIPVRAGDAVAFTSNLWHRSGPNRRGSPRRAFYAQYSSQPIRATPSDCYPLSLAIPVKVSASSCTPRVLPDAAGVDPTQSAVQVFESNATTELQEWASSSRKRSPEKVNEDEGRGNVTEWELMEDTDQGQGSRMVQGGASVSSTVDVQESGCGELVGEACAVGDDLRVKRKKLKGRG
ncbi:unnamed protein product [Choristocarpus tenellus]